MTPVRARKRAVGQRLARSRGSRPAPDPLDLQLAERELELLDDLRPLVGAAEDRAELAGLVVVSAITARRLVVARRR